MWVMFAYGNMYLVCGLAISAALVIWAARCKRWIFRLALLPPAILNLWICLFLSADSGYRNWQSTPNPPKEAFADCGPMVLLFVGWIPSIMIVVPLFLVALLFFAIVKRRKKASCLGPEE